MENLHPEHYFFRLSYSLCDERGVVVKREIEEVLTPDQLIRFLLRIDDTIKAITVIRTYHRPAPEGKSEKEVS